MWVNSVQTLDKVLVSTLQGFCDDFDFNNPSPNLKILRLYQKTFRDRGAKKTGKKLYKNLQKHKNCNIQMWIIWEILICTFFVLILIISRIFSNNHCILHIYKSTCTHKWFKNYSHTLELKYILIWLPFKSLKMIMYWNILEYNHTE